MERHVRRSRPPRHLHRRRGVHRRLRVGPVRERRRRRRAGRAALRAPLRPGEPARRRRRPRGQRVAARARRRGPRRRGHGPAGRTGGGASSTCWAAPVVSIAPDGGRTRYEYDALGPRGPSRATRRPRRCRPSTTWPAASPRSSTSSGRATSTGTRRPVAWPSVAGRPAGSSVGRTTPPAGVASHEADGDAHRARAGRARPHRRGARTRRPGPRRALRRTATCSGLSDAISSERFEVDAAGRVVGAIDGTGHRSTYAWDARGQLAAATDPAGLVVVPRLRRAWSPGRAGQPRR